MQIAIIAHDNMKQKLMDFLLKNKTFFQNPAIKLIATGTTGGLAIQSGFEVERMMSGPLGGDAQIAARVAERVTNMVIFFKDPLANHPHEPDINMLIRVCDVHNAPLATNQATAQLIINAIAQQL
jgi:methylglyoxal synthase